MTRSDAPGGPGPATGLPRWPVRLVDVPPSGLNIRRRDLSAEDLAAFARFIGVEAMTTLDVELHVKPYRGDGLAVSGRVRAAVVQTCIVTLEPMTNGIDEEVEATFRPEEKLKAHLVHDEEDGLSIDASVAADDPLVGGVIDTAAIAAEFLALGVDPYPRKPDSRFDAPSAGAEASPFAGLSKLKRDT
jgi:hypothetical protein